MPSFSYLARDKNSNRKSGVLKSANLKAAASSLLEKGLIPVQIVPEKRQSFKTLNLSGLFVSKLLFLSVFSSSFSKLLSSGLTIPQAMGVLSKQFRTGYVGNTILEIRESLHSGHRLSEVMLLKPKVFPNYLAALCQAGEESGCLAETLGRASLFFERLRLLKNRLASALIYPSFLAGLSLLTVSVLFTLILPRITSVYAQLGTELPWQTNLLISVGNFIQDNYHIGVILLIIFFLIIGILGWQNRAMSFSSWIKYRVPFLGKILSSAELADQLSVLGMLISHGVSLPKALRVTTTLAGFERQKLDFSRAATDVETGRSFADSMASAKTVPVFIKDMIALGEEADCLSDSLENGSNIIKSEVDQKLVVFTTLFEPIMVLLMAVVIGFIVFSVLLPILNVDFAS